MTKDFEVFKYCDKGTDLYKKLSVTVCTAFCTA